MLLTIAIIVFSLANCKVLNSAINVSDCVCVYLIVSYLYVVHNLVKRQKCRTKFSGH